ncbi:MAG: hypothetical protein HQL50_07435 [Magnetococcales bacterium]|nr:hypothetical protein [Magnetococcales bacterium]
MLLSVLPVGPGLALKSILPFKISLISFLFGHLVLEAEVLFWLLQDEIFTHRYLHSPAGVLLASLIAAPVGLIAGNAFVRLWNKRRTSDTHPLTYIMATTGPFGHWFSAFAGASATLAINAATFFDVQPLTPFRNDNPLLGSVPEFMLDVYAGSLALGGVTAMLASRILLMIPLFKQLIRSRNHPASSSSKTSE